MILWWFDAFFYVRKPGTGAKRAAVRKLQHELGIDPSQLDVDSFVRVVRFAYCAHDTPYSENESLLLIALPLGCTNTHC